MRRRRDPTYSGSISKKQDDCSSSDDSDDDKFHLDDEDTTGKQKSIGYIVYNKKHDSSSTSSHCILVLSCSVVVLLLLFMSCVPHAHNHWYHARSLLRPLTPSFSSLYGQPPSPRAAATTVTTTTTAAAAATPPNTNHHRRRDNDADADGPSKWTEIARKYGMQSTTTSQTGEGRDYLWSQNVGLHHLEYYKKKGVCHALPPGRSQHTVVGYGVNSSGFVYDGTARSLLTARQRGRSNSYLVAFGGRLGQGAKKTYSRGRSQLLNDTWLFVSGVANTTILEDLVDGRRRPNMQRGEPRDEEIRKQVLSSNTVRSVLDPFTGKSCLEGADGSLTDSTKCSSCNRWHRVKTKARSRWSSECLAKRPLNHVRPDWCLPEATTGTTTTGLSTASTSLNRSGHVSYVISSASDPTDGASSVIMFGGETSGTTGTGETFDNDVWYLSGLVTPTTGAVSAVSAEPEAEWRCLETYSHYDPFPGTKSSETSTACGGGSGLSIDVGTVGGTIGSGTLSPMHGCTWVLSNKTAHAIVLDVTTLDLDHAKLCRSGHVEIYDGDVATGILLGRGCSLGIGDTSWDSGRFTAFSGKMTVSMQYESPCSNHNGFEATYRLAETKETTGPLSCKRTCPSKIPCLDVCHGRGQCVHGSCACSQGFYGVDCEHRCSPMSPCDRFQGRRSGVSNSNHLGFPRPRRSHTAVSVPLNDKTVVLQRWTDTETNPTTPVSSTTTCPTVMKGEETMTTYEPLELGESGLVRNLTSTEIKFTFAGNADRIVTLVQTKASVSGTRRALFFGGELRSGQGVTDELWSLDLMEPTVDALAGCAVSERKLEVAASGGSCSMTTTRCDTYPSEYPHFPRPPLHNRWTRWRAGGTGGPEGRSGHTAAYMRGVNAMVVFGGRSSTGGVLGDLWGLDLATASGSSFGDVGPASSPSKWNNVTWIRYSPIGQRAKVESAVFDGEFSGTVVHERGVATVLQDEHVKLELELLGGTEQDTVSLSYAHVFHVSADDPRSSSSTFRFISNRTATKATESYKGVVEIFPRPRTDHAASVMMLDKGETMVVYGGVGAGPKMLDDVWLLTLVESNDGGGVVAQWTQVQKREGNFLAASYSSVLFNIPSNMKQQRYGAGMIPVVSSINMGMDGVVERTSHVKESLLVFGGVSKRKVSDGFNHDYQAPWRGIEYFQGGKDPLLFFMCPESDV